MSKVNISVSEKKWHPYIKSKESKHGENTVFSI